MIKIRFPYLDFYRTKYIHVILKIFLVADLNVAELNVFIERNVMFVMLHLLYNSYTNIISIYCSFLFRLCVALNFVALFPDQFFSLVS